MDIVRLCIPFEFVRERANVSWREVLFGLRNDLLDPLAPVEMSLQQVARIKDPPSLMVDLAATNERESILGLVQQLAENEPDCPAEEIRDKWLYLVLAWVFEHQSEYPDPLRRVEEIYADFDYPEQVVSFVRYMPLDGPDLGGREANEERLLKRWERYIEEAASKYSP